MGNNDQQGASFEKEDSRRFISEHRRNIKSDLIEITEDKLENILLKHIKRMGTRMGWLAPLGIFIAVVLATVSATFSSRFGISASTWEAVFILAAICSFIWLLVSIGRMCVYWKESSMESLICKIKASDKG